MLAGEGVLGLARSFLLAGGRSVVATLWPVVSDPTVALMRDFYTHLLAGEEPAAAMRRAQLDLAGRPGTASPLFWAGFAYVGR
jgi:CHAT domain-containing protein